MFVCRYILCIWYVTTTFLKQFHKTFHKTLPLKKISSDNFGKVLNIKPAHSSFNLSANVQLIKSSCATYARGQRKCTSVTEYHIVCA